MSCKRAAAWPDCLHTAGWEYSSGGMLRELLMMIALLYFFCCFLRPICFPIAEIVLICWGIERLGEHAAFLLGVAGTEAGIAAMFLLSGHISGKIMEKRRSSGKFEEFALFVREHEKLAIAGLFVLPVLPDSVVCIGAGAMKLRSSSFLVISTAAKALSIGMTVYAQQLADRLSIAGWQIMLLEFAVLYLLAMVWKKKETEGRTGFRKGVSAHMLNGKAGRLRMAEKHCFRHGRKWINVPLHEDRE